MTDPACTGCPPVHLVGMRDGERVVCQRCHRACVWNEEEARWERWNEPTVKEPHASPLRNIAAFIRHVVNPANAQMAGSTLTSLAECADELDALAAVRVPLPADVHAAAREVVEARKTLRLRRRNGGGGIRKAKAAEYAAIDRLAVVLARAVLARPASTVPTDASLPTVNASDMQRREELMRAGIQHAVVDDNGKIMQVVGLGARRYLPEPDDIEGAASEGVRVEGVVQSFDRAFGILVIKTHDNIDPLFVESLEPRVAVAPQKDPE